MKKIIKNKEKSLIKSVMLANIFETQKSIP